MNTADIIRRFGVERSEHIAVKWDGGQQTYAELDARSSQVAQALRASGIGAGDRVAFLDMNGPEHLEVTFGAAKLGAVFTPVNFRLATVEVQGVVDDCDATVWIVGAAFAELAATVAAGIDRPIELVVIGDGAGHTGYADWLAAHPAEDPRVPVTAEHVAAQVYSSGTTGRPKGAELTHANVEACISLWDDLMGLSDPDVVCLSPLPLFHIGGHAWALAAHRFGATNVLVREPVPAKLVALLGAERITHAALVPALIRALLAVPDVREQDLSALRGILYGASPITETLLREAMATFHCIFIQAYGLTETTSTVVHLPAADHDPDGPNTHRLRACGVPVRDVHIRVVDPMSLEDLGPDETGEFWIKGPNVMRGYYKQPELTDESIVDGWFRSGDVGYRDVDGYLYVRDRTGDVIISGAENIYPTEVENVLAAHPAVADCAVIGVPSERWGETPRAIVVPAPDTDPSPDELIEHCRESLARYKCPSGVDFVDELPRNPAGKVLKKELRAPFWEGHERAL